MQNTVASSSDFSYGTQGPVDVRRMLKITTIILSFVPILLFAILFCAAFIPGIETAKVPLVVYSMNGIFLLQIILRVAVRMNFTSALFKLSLLVEFLWLIALLP